MNAPVETIGDTIAVIVNKKDGLYQQGAIRIANTVVAEAGTVPQETIVKATTTYPKNLVIDYSG